MHVERLSLEPIRKNGGLDDIGRLLNGMSLDFDVDANDAQCKNWVDDEATGISTSQLLFFNAFRSKEITGS